MDADHKNSNLEDATQVLGYFRCKHCNRPDPWEFDNWFHFSLIGYLITVAATKKIDSHDSGFITLGPVQLFDGTNIRWATEGEDPS